MFRSGRSFETSKSHINYIIYLFINKIRASCRTYYMRTCQSTRFESVLAPLDRSWISYVHVISLYTEIIS